MPRLRNGQTGAVVSCSDETAARLVGDWQPVEAEKKVEPEPEQKPQRRKRSASK